MSKLLDKIVFIGSLIAIVGLLGSYTARYIDPNTFVIPSLLGLAYPYLLLSNLLLLLYWIARWKKNRSYPRLCIGTRHSVFHQLLRHQQQSHGRNGSRHSGFILQHTLFRPLRLEQRR